MEAQDKVFFRNFSITVIVLAVFMAVILVAARVIASVSLPKESDNVISIAERTAPVGRLVTAQDEPQKQEPVVAAASDTDSAPPPAVAGGEAIYSGLCISCHGSGIPGIPQLGDAAAWVERIAKGKESLYANAINGYTGTSGIPMPAKGGNPSLSDADVQAAVDYMLENSQ